MKGMLALLVVAIGILTQGCSIYKAATAPPPVAFDRIKVGADRTDVISVLGLPKSTEALDGQRTDMFEFTDGYSSATKSRIALYVAGDVFTLGLAELIFWPMELAVLNGDEGRAVTTYGTDNIVRTVQITKKNGMPWFPPTGSQSAPVEEVTRRD